MTMPAMPTWLPNGGPGSVGGMCMPPGSGVPGSTSSLPMAPSYSGSSAMPSMPSMPAMPSAPLMPSLPPSTSTNTLGGPSKPALSASATFGTSTLPADQSSSNAAPGSGYSQGVSATNKIATKPELAGRSVNFDPPQGGSSACLGGAAISKSSTTSPLGGNPLGGVATNKSALAGRSLNFDGVPSGGSSACLGGFGANKSASTSRAGFDIPQSGASAVSGRSGYCARGTPAAASGTAFDAGPERTVSQGVALPEIPQSEASLFSDGSLPPVAKYSGPESWSVPAHLKNCCDAEEPRCEHCGTFLKRRVHHASSGGVLGRGAKEVSCSICRVSIADGESFLTCANQAHAPFVVCGGCQAMGLDEARKAFQQSIPTPPTKSERSTTCFKGHTLKHVDLGAMEGFVHSRACCACGRHIPRSEPRHACVAKECKKEGYYVCVDCVTSQDVVLTCSCPVFVMKRRLKQGEGVVVGGKKAGEAAAAHPGRVSCMLLKEGETLNDITEGDFE